MPLQQYKGFYVDYRLQQFRTATLTGVIEFLDFTSERGDLLLSQMIQEGVADLDRIKL